MEEFKDWVHHKWDKDEIKQPKPYCVDQCKRFKPVMCPIKEPIVSIGTGGHTLVINKLLQCGNVFECDKYDGLSEYLTNEKE